MVENAGEDKVGEKEDQTHALPRDFERISLIFSFSTSRNSCARGPRH